MTGQLHAAAAAVWRELAYEMRRHAGDERLPQPLRVRLREAAQHALARSARVEPRSARYQRREIRRRMAERAEGAPASRERSRGAAPVVVAMRRALERCEPAIAFLREAGYEVRTVPTAGTDGLAPARFVITDIAAVQQAAEANGTPALTVNVEDVFSGYPVHPESLFVLRPALDLDTGRLIPIEERLTERYYRNLRNTGYRSLRAADLLEAAREMHAVVSGGAGESESQRRFRAQAVQAGAALAARVPAVAVWGPDEGYLGDGRLAQFQADSAAAAADGGPAR
jgi:hypothetical protein